MPTLRPYVPGDAGAVLALNQSHPDSVGPLDVRRQAWLVSLADSCLVADVAGELAGFVVTVAPGTAYDSPNYRWFEGTYADFAYLDRVVVAEAHQRRGIGSLIYDAVEERARPRGRITLEVYAEPPNVGSLAFHAARGYVEVGRLAQGNGKVAAMFVKELG
ncbi:MAG: GNAT family N-acetyltransferase [Actinomycetota bacterium]|nr:GNAT family N-acetyltransferase [Actinomycetota bacterium]